LGLSLTFFFFFLNTYDLIFSVVTSDHWIHNRLYER
jgi:hypothetical protein